MSESKAHHVEIRDVDGQTLLKLVDYIYTAEIEVSEDNVQVSQDTCTVALLCKGCFALGLWCSVLSTVRQGISSHY